MAKPPCWEGEVVLLVSAHWGGRYDYGEGDDVGDRLTQLLLFLSFILEGIWTLRRNSASFSGNWVLMYMPEPSSNPAALVSRGTMAI